MIKLPNGVWEEEKGRRLRTSDGINNINNAEEACASRVTSWEGNSPKCVDLAFGPSSRVSCDVLPL